MLLETIRANNEDNISPHQIAIAADSGTAYLDGVGSGAGLSKTTSGDAGVEVNTVDLDAFGHSHRLWPDVIKVDVEGAEFDVLRGARRCLQYCRLVCLELHFDSMSRFGGSVDAIRTLLADHGFREVVRARAYRQGRDDPTRAHVIFEKEATRLADS